MVRQGHLVTTAPAALSGGVCLTGISKRFGALQVLRNVDLHAPAGEIHGLIGENGAGKTTLMRILAGLERADSGTVEIAGTLLPRGHTAIQALAAGVGLVPQHCEVAPTLTVLESLSLGREPSRWGLYNRGEVRRDGQRIAEQLRFEFDWDSPAESLSMAQRQRLELVRLLMRNAGVLILDEPTTVLTAQEVEGLFDTLRPLAAAGRTILFITHKLSEIRRLADNITVLRAGTVVGRVAARQSADAQLAQMMIGQLTAPPERDTASTPGSVRLRLSGVQLAAIEVGMHPLHEVSLQVAAGEIVGIAGVEGNGQDELVDVISGLRHPDAGSIEIDGHPVEKSSALRRRTLGLAVIPSDRMHEGANLQAKVWETATAGRAAATERTVAGFLPIRSLRARGAAIARRVGVLAPASLHTGALSGGNIQRVIVGRELDGDPAVVLTAHPTRGVDVRGIAFIHQQLFDLRAAGKAVLVLSADLDELIAIADRIHVLTGGRLLVDFVPGERTTAEVGLMMSGASPGTGESMEAAS
ncbi:MAG: ABC transporter ATP-binding protein [Streptosporangiaceae bacterium]